MLCSFQPKFVTHLDLKFLPLPGLKSEISNKHKPFKEALVTSDEQPFGWGRVSLYKTLSLDRPSVPKHSFPVSDDHYVVGKVKEKAKGTC